MTDATDKNKILIIDDDPIYRKLSGSILSERFTVFTAEAPSEAFKILQKEPIRFIICDYRLPEMDGLQVLGKVKEQYPHIEVIMISSSGNMDTVIEALRKGAADFFKKPFTAADIWMSIERTQKFASLQECFQQEKKKNIFLQEEVNREIGVSIVGKSAQIIEIKEQMKMVAQTPDTSVLIIGESGTGKELVARGIHNMSKRSNEVFGAVNMSAIPESLFESEFFGHKKGSFTGAIADKAGWLESSNKGTLFLDEIGEMSMGLQVKLLRVLEDRTYTRVGTSKSKEFDVRIVAATNKQVEELTGGENFRLDLFHRIGTFIINLPPLRDRKNDIAYLAHYFFHLHNQRMGKNIQGISSKAIDLLEKYDFPGNIRELRNIMERAVIMCNEKELQPKHFSLLSSTKPSSSIFENTFNLEEIEKQTIIGALQKTNYNKSEASRLLNIEWNALYRRIKKHGIEM